MTEILAILHKPFVIIMMIFVVVFVAIVLTRLIFAFLLNRAYKHYQELKKAGKKILRNKKKILKEEDELLRRKDEIPRAHSEVKAEKRARAGQESGSYELIPSREQELDSQELNETKIVDIVKPIGFWTSMILGQKLTYLIQSAQTINKRDKQGFWVSMIEAKERQQGKQHARGR